MLALKLDAIDVACLPAQLHNDPSESRTRCGRRSAPIATSYDEILCLYGDCGTGGELDRVLARGGAPHRRARIATNSMPGRGFRRSPKSEPGTFYLTDFLARHFDALVIRGLGLDRFPVAARRDDYFGNYRRVVHLAQFDDPDIGIDEGQKAAAERLAASPMSAASPASMVFSCSFLEGATHKRAAVSRRALPALLARHSKPGHRESRTCGGQTPIVERLIRAIDAAAMHAGAESVRQRSISRRVARPGGALRRRSGSGG